VRINLDIAFGFEAKRQDYLRLSACPGVPDPRFFDMVLALAMFALPI
jgi:hypothetical protein